MKATLKTKITNLNHLLDKIMTKNNLIQTDTDLSKIANQVADLPADSTPLSDAEKKKKILLIYRQRLENC